MNTKLPCLKPAPRLDGQLCFAAYSTSLAMSKLYRKVAGMKNRLDELRASLREIL